MNVQGRPTRPETAAVPSRETFTRRIDVQVVGGVDRGIDLAEFSKVTRPNWADLHKRRIT